METCRRTSTCAGFKAGNAQSPCAWCSVIAVKGSCRDKTSLDLKLALHYGARVQARLRDDVINDLVQWEAPGTEATQSHVTGAGLHPIRVRGLPFTWKEIPGPDNSPPKDRCFKHAPSIAAPQP
eukprot:scaffold37747_cov15-Tisochrysis_lutea.AAC.1